MIKNTKQITVEVNEILLQEMSKITNDENNILYFFLEAMQ